jgi:hypothetical protein
MTKKVDAIVLTLLIGGSALLPEPSVAQEWAQDRGRIIEVYANDTESVAIRLDRGFSAAAQKFRNCPGGAEGFAGFAGPKPAMTSLLLTAYSSGRPIVVTTLECIEGWFKIIDVHAFRE